MYYRSISEMVGGTPLLEAVNYNKNEGLEAKVLLKLESFNPAGSAKDRVALCMILAAENEGKLTQGATIIEPTSGNTGIGLAAIGVPRGYRVILTMPDTMSMERRRLLAAYGAEIVLTPGKLGMQGAIDKATELAAATPGSFIPSQFDNPANPMAHRTTTGPEIYEDTDGHVDILVAGVGTGGTISGTAKFLKSKIPSLVAVAAEPASSPLLSGGKAGAHGLQGIGANFVPANFDRDAVDEILPVTEAQAYAAARKLAKCEGVLVGISSGAALHAATVLARRPENRGKVIVAVLPDGGDRYLSTPLFAD
ncbi:MAG: cysteine synthase A [Clostridia bacterium]|nr:cysteine synthase A [Clostridia bacterium]MBQ9801986.1 cysteine synthase A [Clostridia bacterium]